MFIRAYQRPAVAICARLRLHIDVPVTSQVTGTWVSEEVHMNTSTIVTVAAMVLLLFFAGIMVAMRKKKLRFWQTMLLLGAPLVLLLAFAVGYLKYCESRLAPFKPHLNEYLAFSMVQQGEPYVRGKVITIDTRRKAVDHLYFDLPQELRATQPEEVGTVVWVNCTSTTTVVRRVGGSTNNTMEYRCEVSVIDKAASAVVGKQTFEKTSGEQGYEEVLYGDIASYLAGLPRR